MDGVLAFRGIPTKDLATEDTDKSRINCLLAIVQQEHFQVTFALVAIAHEQAHLAPERQDGEHIPRNREGGLPSSAETARAHRQHALLWETGLLNVDVVRHGLKLVLPVQEGGDQGGARVMHVARKLAPRGVRHPLERLLALPIHKA